jgi:Sulfotransferase family
VHQESRSPEQVGESTQSKPVTAQATGSQPASVQGEPSEVHRPIFIVGCHRSGTSVLRQTLDSHPRISAGPEDPTTFWLSKTDTVLTRSRREGYGYDEEDWFATVRGLVGSIHSRYAANQGKTRWASKHPENSLILDYVNRVFPDCQVIHIVRNPRDVLSSNRRKFGKKRGFFYGRRWALFVGSAEKVGARMGEDRFRTIRYEDLVSDPESLLKDLVEWLGEPWSDEVLHISRRTHRYPATIVPPEEQDLSLEINTGSVGRGGRGEGYRIWLPLLYLRLRANDLVKKFGYEIRFVRH